MVARTWRRLVRRRGADAFAANGAVQAEVGHQPLDSAACNREAFAQHLTPDLARAVHFEVLDEDTLDTKTRSISGLSARSRFARADSLPGSERLAT